MAAMLRERLTSEDEKQISAFEKNYKDGVEEMEKKMNAEVERMVGEVDELETPGRYKENILPRWHEMLRKDHKRREQERLREAERAKQEKEELKKLKAEQKLLAKQQKEKKADQQSSKKQQKLSKKKAQESSNQGKQTSLDVTLKAAAAANAAANSTTTGKRPEAPQSIQAVFNEVLASTATPNKQGTAVIPPATAGSAKKLDKKQVQSTKKAGGKKDSTHQ